MQPSEKIRNTNRSREKQPFRTHHLSSFGILNRNGLEINTTRDILVDEEENEIKSSEFMDWSMPEQRSGYLQGKKHDFF